MNHVSYDGFFRSAYPRLVALGVSMSGSREVAQELAQETMLRAHRRFDEVGAMESPYGWCRRVMSNLLIDQHRSKRAERAAVDRLGVLVSADRSHSRSVGESVMDGDAWGAIVATLTPRQRCIATLYYAEDMAVADVAAELGVTTGSVKSTLAQVRRRVERLFDHVGDEKEQTNGS